MNYYTEIENYIKKNEINKRARVLEENHDLLQNYWNIWCILVEAQGGEKRAKYGNSLIKEWSIKYTEKYGKGYDATNLRKFRQLFLLFPNCATLSRISWSQLVTYPRYKQRNYYVNFCGKRNLSVRDLRKEVKNNAYERLIDKPEKIEIERTIDKKWIFSEIKSPILLEMSKENLLQSEKDLEVLILAQLKNFFAQLESGFAFIENYYRNPFLFY